MEEVRIGRQGKVHNECRGGEEEKKEEKGKEEEDE